MKIEFKDSFAKDIRCMKDKRQLKSVKDVIETVEKTDSLAEIPNLKKLKGGGDFYRLRVGNFRIGISYSNDTLFFVRLLNRKDIYKYFP